MPEPKRILWIDLETTGLDPSVDLILEIGAIITDEQLEELTRFHVLVDNGVSVDQCIALCDDFVKDMHVQSGLWADLLGAERAKARMQIPGTQLDVETLTTYRRFMTLDQITHAFKCWTRLWNAIGGPTAGFSAHFDRGFLKAHAPFIDACFNRRCFDVSTFKFWFDEHEKGNPRHRAVADCREAIEAMASFRGRVVP